ncbi:MAG: sugar-binding protein [Phycisphaeraceae bacterium]
MSKCRFIAASLLFLSLSLAGCGKKDGGDLASPGQPSGKKITIAFVTNGPDRFWNIAQAGVLQAGKDFNVDAEFRAPQPGADFQKQVLEDLVTRGINGIAVSPIDPDNQHDLLNSIASKTILITHDSDAPKTNRKFYVGIDNYKAGREAGKLVKKAIPDGGKIIVFVGRLEQLNARQRRQGLIDEVLDRPMQTIATLKVDPNNGPIGEGKYVFVNTYVDQFKSEQYTAQPRDAITATPDVACMVGLFAYNPPAIIQAVRESGNLGKIKIVGFDEHDETLAAITEGIVEGTIAQQPYEYGYQSVKILTALIKKDDKSLPKETEILLLPIVVKKEGPDVPAPLEGSPALTVNAKAFRADVNKKLDTLK